MTDNYDLREFEEVNDYIVQQLVKENCKRCLWGEECVGERSCMYYTPLDEWSGQTSEIFVEAERTQFRREWNGYIDEDVVCEELYFN